MQVDHRDDSGGVRLDERKRWAVVVFSAGLELAAEEAARDIKDGTGIS